ncbi:MAG: TlpA family protein disulfide reductase [Thermoguttaceae bacterium]|nr:TlpA family protein disulfide reductase [Thermoguttaceae bacterium]
MLLPGSILSRLAGAGRLAAFVGVLVACAGVYAQKPEQILNRAPGQADVDVDYPADADVDKCVTKQFKEQGYTGIALYAPDGTTLLRVWAAPAPKSGQKASVEQIRFYKNGIEVYRDVLGKEARWFNTGGSRRGVLGADKKTIESWSVISPQEATQEAVAALKTNDFARYQRVALSAKDFASLGLSGPVASEIQKQIQSVTPDAFSKLAQTLNIPEDAKWGALNSGCPATIPAGENLANDIEAYYNVTIIVMKRGETAQSQDLYVGDLVKVGDAWKLVGLPVGEPFGQATGAVSASSVLLPTEGAATAVSETGDVGEMGSALTDAYRKLESATPQNYPALCDQTVELLLNLAASNPQETDNMLSQAVDVVFTGIQSGMYPNGVEKLASLAEKINESGSNETKARVRQRQITAEFYTIAQSQPQPKPSELSKAQDKYTEDLTAFAEEFAGTAAGAEAAMSLALDQEYLLENDAAINYYQQVAKNAGTSNLGRKAQGAVARLQMEGKPFNAPKLTYVDGSPVNFSVPGKPTIVFFWGSWDQESVDKVKQVAAQANVVGINVDSAPDQGTAKEYFQQIVRGVPWKNVCDPNGLDGEAAVAFGVQTAPWIILIGKDGVVVRSNIANLDELADVLKELK